MLDPVTVAAWAGVGLVSVVNVATVGYFAGRLSARMTTLTAAVTRLENLHMSNPGPKVPPPSIGPATRIAGGSDDPDT